MKAEESGDRERWYPDMSSHLRRSTYPVTGTG